MLGQALREIAASPEGAERYTLDERGDFVPRVRPMSDIVGVARRRLHAPALFVRGRPAQAVRPGSAPARQALIAVAVNWRTSPSRRAISIAPSSVPSTIDAVASGGQGQRRLPSAQPSSSTARSHVVFAAKKSHTACCGSSGGSRARRRMPHRHPVGAEHAGVEVDVAAQLGRGVGRRGIEFGERGTEPHRVALDQRLPEFALAGEVVVQRRRVMPSSVATSP